MMVEIWWLYVDKVEGGICGGLSGQATGLGGFQRDKIARQGIRVEGSIL